MTQAYPLQWPQEQPRGNQAGGPFKHDKRAITHGRALDRLFDELRLLGVPEDDVIVSTNLQVRRADGLPKAGQRIPDDTGVAVYFTRIDQEICVACDSYYGVPQNIAGVAAVINGLRQVERHGTQFIEKAFRGFTALPGPDHFMSAPWRQVLCVGNDEMHLERVKRAWLKLRSDEHPDKGGDEDRYIRINEAWKQAEQELTD